LFRINFAIDSLLEIGYIVAAPQGVNGKRYLTKCNQQSAISRIATLCRSLGGLGDLGWNWVYIGGRGWGLAEGGRQRVARIAGIAEIARHRRDRKSKTLPLIKTDDTDQNKARQIPSPKAAAPHDYRKGHSLIDTDNTDQKSVCDETSDHCQTLAYTRRCSGNAGGKACFT
jgi:hypothetical protein